MSKFREIVAWSLLLTGSAWGNACATSSTGLFQSVTWSTCGGTYPHQGDTATISGGAVVTIPTSEADNIGASPAANAANLTITGSGTSLVVDGTLEMWAGIAISAGGNLTLNNNTSTTPLTFATTQGTPPCYGITFSSTTRPFSSITTNGTSTLSFYEANNANTLVTINVAGTSPANCWYMATASSNDGVLASLNFTVLNTCGSNGTTKTECLGGTGSGNAWGGDVTFYHVLFTNSTGMSYAFSSNQGTQNFQYMHHRNSQSLGASSNIYMVFLNNLGTKGIYTRQLVHSTSYKGTHSTGDADILLQESGLTIDDVIALNTFNTVNSATSSVDAQNTAMLTLSLPFLTDTNPQSVISPGSGLNWTQIVIAEPCQNGLNGIREANVNVPTAPVSNAINDAIIIGPARSGCNTNRGNFNGYFFAAGSNSSGSGTVLTNVAGIHTIGSMLTITGSNANNYVTMRNVTVVDNLATTVSNGTFTPSALSPSANKVIKLSTIWEDSSDTDVAQCCNGTWVPQASGSYWDFTNTSNHTTLPSNIFRIYSSGGKVLGPWMVSNSTSSSVYTQDGTATVSGAPTGTPCVVTYTSLTGSVNVGDYVLKSGGTLQAPVIAQSGSTATIGYDNTGAQSCLGLANGNTVLFGKGPIAPNGTDYYGSKTGYGANDSSLQPYFPNTAASYTTWDAMLGGPGTIADYYHKILCYVDGVAEDGYAGGPYCASHVPGTGQQDFYNWLHQSLTIYNAAAAHSGEGGIDPGYNGVYNSSVNY